MAQDPGSTLDFQLLFHSLPGLYLILDTNFVIVAASDAHLRSTKTTRENVIGRNVFDVFPENPQQSDAGSEKTLRASFERVLKHRTPDVMSAFKYDIRTPDSEGGGFEERFWSVVNSPYCDGSGKITHIINRAEDVTEFVRLKRMDAEKDRKAAELRQHLVQVESEIYLRAKELAEAKVTTELLRQSEARQRELADAMPQIVWAARPDGSFDYANRRFREFVGLPAGQNGDYNWQMLLHPDDRAKCFVAWRASVMTGHAFEVEARFVDRINRSYRWFLSRALPVRDPTGAIIRWYGSCTDIDAWKRAQQELRVARDAAESANHAKDQFLAVLSHELRTPLTPVLLTVSLLENSSKLPQEVQDDIQMIRRHVELEARLIDDLLDLTRIARGKLQLNLETVDAHILIKNALDICCMDRRSELKLELNAKEHFVRADPARLQQIFWNLLSNAAKFTPPGAGIRVTTGNPTPGMIRFEVIDAGVGIEPEVLPTIFNAFQQGDSSLTRNFGGLGLGLTITRSLVEAHGASLRARSDGKGKGATFTLEMSSVSAAMAQSKAPSRRPMWRAPSPSTNPLRVLLVEDHPGTLALMTRLLSQLGHEVKTAINVKDALELAKHEQVDLVISDLGLPDGTGYDLMKSLKSRYSLKGIAVSGFGMDEDVRKSMESGFAKHLIKPINLEKLQLAIQQLKPDAV